jgi:hypothetical protein
MELTELIAYVKTAQMPTLPVKVNAYMTVEDNFVASQIEAAQAGDMSARLRLELFYEYLEALPNYQCGR